MCYGNHNHVLCKLSESPVVHVGVLYPHVYFVNSPVQLVFFLDKMPDLHIYTLYCIVI